jgi:outer membrane lipoprotein
MKVSITRCVLVLLASVVLLSCSPLSRSVRQEAETGIAFEAVRHDPETYVGKKLVLGGYILQVVNMPKVTKITVLQTPLGAQDRPQSREQSQGRFVAVYDGFLDPAVYEEGRMLTVAGAVLGKEVIQIDGHSYPSVAIKPIETHLWKKEEIRPYPFYDPYYYPYFYDPWYPRYGYRDPFYRSRPPIKKQ